MIRCILVPEFTKRKQSNANEKKLRTDLEEHEKLRPKGTKGLETGTNGNYQIELDKRLCYFMKSKRSQSQPWDTSSD
ncbi:hypothetical protein Tco_0625550 [Tanacetum coccineum]|uniref:Uncharacterized protein n=1 Tax=Tanacetum coccineum TaxID=301880 RepID=A0ABQ4WH47_9ASTR